MNRTFHRLYIKYHRLILALLLAACTAAAWHLELQHDYDGRLVVTQND